MRNGCDPKVDISGQFSIERPIILSKTYLFFFETSKLCQFFFFELSAYNATSEGFQRKEQ